MFSVGIAGKLVKPTGKPRNFHCCEAAIPVPNNGPLLFVYNHQFIGYNIRMIIAQILMKHDISAWGLTHPIMFQGGNAVGNSLGMTSPMQL